MESLADKKLRFRIAVSALFFNQGIVFSAWATRIPDFKKSLALSDAQLGSLLFALPVGQLSVMALSGWLTARFTSRRVVRVAAFIYPLMLCMVRFADSFASLFLLLLAFGMSANFTNISINTQAIDTERIYGKSINASFHGIWSFAGFVGGVVGAWLVGGGVGVGAHFAAVAAYVWICTLAIVPNLVPTDFPPKPDESGRTRGALRPTPFILLLGAITFSCMSCEGTMFNWSIVYFRDVIGAPDETARLGFISFMSTMAGGRLLADFFINRFGRLAVLRASGAMITSGMLLAALLPNIAAASAGFMLVGFGVSSVVPISYSLAGRSRRMPSGVAIAVVSTIGFFGFLIFPPLVGFVSELSSLRVSLSMMCCVGIMVALLAPLLRARIAEMEKPKARE
ncbi:MAG: MFS transporter [Opitutales bacterium]|nr:MFS transporter [Opitutales bacterium]